MPPTLTYPGVYVTEIPSGVRTITGVATSITAFIGRTIKGPTNSATSVNSFGEFERIFGGLWFDSPMTYAVRDFFGNGGGQAIIVRLFKTSTGNDDMVYATRLTFENHEDLFLTAINPGVWGNELHAKLENIQHDVWTGLEPLYLPPGPYQQFKLKEEDLFNLTVWLGDGVPETFINLSFKDGPRRIDRILAANSTLVRWDTTNHTLDGKKEEDLPKVSFRPGTALRPALVDDRTKAQADYNTNVKPINNDLIPLYTALADLQATLATLTKENEKLQADTTASEEDKNAKKEAVETQQGLVNDQQTKINEQLDKKNKLISDLKTAIEENGGSDSDNLTAKADYIGDTKSKRGLHALDDADLYNLLCIPPNGRDADLTEGVYQEAMAYCVERRAMLIVDPMHAWATDLPISATKAAQWLDALGLFGEPARNAVLYFPLVNQKDPQLNGQIDLFVPCGMVAGMIARNDALRGVWKAPAGIEATLNGIDSLQINLTNEENGYLNQNGINCLRSFPIIGDVAWGARTLRGADRLADEYKYLPVRRLALYIEESLFRGLQWVVFEPNDEPLWAQIRLNAGAFMRGLFRQGAFKGSKPSDAYFVKCDAENNPQADIDRGIVNILVGFAPLKPAEFVVLKLQQISKLQQV